MADFYSVHELESTKFNLLEFEGKWEASFGQPEVCGVWLIYGESFNGKSSFTVQLAKYLTQFVKHKVLINSLEEGKSQSFKLNIQRAALTKPEADKILLGDRVPMEKVAERLRKQRSPEIVITDSLQYTGLDKKSYTELKEEFRKKLWIFISQADGAIPRGALAKHIRFDADIKIRVEGFKAFPESRFGGGEPYVINAERAAKYHGNIE